jgi:hypothetical protein
MLHCVQHDSPSGGGHRRSWEAGHLPLVMLNAVKHPPPPSSGYNAHPAGEDHHPTRQDELCSKEEGEDGRRTGDERDGNPDAAI